MLPAEAIDDVLASCNHVKWCVIIYSVFRETYVVRGIKSMPQNCAMEHTVLNAFCQKTFFRGARIK